MASGTLRVRAIGDFKDLNKKVQGAGGRLGKFGKKARAVGGSMSRKLTLPILAAGGAALKTAADFQSGMKRVEALTGATGKSLGKLKGLAKKLGRTTQFSASEAAEGMQFLAQAGFETEDIMSALPGTLDLAAAGQLELADAADIASNVLTGYGMEANEIGRVNDVLAKTSTSANTDVMQLGEAMKMVAPVAKSSGLAFEETSAALGALGDAGIQGTMAGTTLRGVIAALESPSKQAAKSIDELGINTHDAQGNMLPLVDIVKQFEDAGMSSADAMTIFGRRAGPGMAALVQQGSDKLKGFTGDLENSGGTAKRIADKQMEGLKGSMLRLKAALEGVAIAIGESGLLDAVTSFAEKLAGVFQRLAETNPALLKIGVIIAGVVAAIGPLLIMVGLMASGLGSIIAVAPKVVMAIKGIGVALKFLAMNPVGLVIVAIAAAIAIGIALWKNWDKVTAAVGKALGWLGDRFSDARDWVTRQIVKVIAKGVELHEWFKALPGRVWDALQDFAGRVWDFVVEYHPVAILLRKAAEFWPKLRKWFADLPGNIVSALSALGRRLADVGRSALNALWDAIKAVGRGLLNYFKNYPRNAANNLGNLGRKLADVGRSALNALWDAIKAVGRGLLSYFKNLPRRVVSRLGNLGRLLVSAGKDLMRGFINGVKRMAGRVVDAVKAPVEGAINGAKRLLRIGSPSKVTEEMGRNIGEGFAGGMGQSSRLVKASAEGLARAAIPGQVDALRSFGAGRGVGTAGRSGGVHIENLTLKMEGGEELLSSDPRKRREQARKIMRTIQELEDEIR